MLIEAILRRLLLYRLMRYRVAWVAFTLLGFYLTAVIVLVIYVHRQVTATGTLATCRAQGSAVEVTLREYPGLALRVEPGSFAPQLPSDFCQVGLAVTLTYETSAFRGPSTVDVVVLGDAPGATHYSTASGRDFSTAKRLTLLVWGGGMALASLAALGVVVFWHRVGHVLQRSQKTRKRNAPLLPVPLEFEAQVEEDLHWLAALPWGQWPVTDLATAEAAFARGVALVRGWGGDETRLSAGVDLLLQSTPALAYTGAAEVALQVSAHPTGAWAVEGARAALAYAEHALTLDPSSVDAALTRIAALAALGTMGDASALQAAAVGYRDVHALGEHPRLASALAAIHLARGQIRPAIVALRAALRTAPSPEEAEALLRLLQQTLERSGQLRQALRLSLLLSNTDAASVKARAALAPILAQGHLAPSGEF